MADPRAAVNHEGIGYKAETYPYDDTIVYDATKVGGAAQVGLAVTLESSNSISLVGDGEQVEGKLIKVEPDFCVVQYAGNMTLAAGTGAALTAGKKIVGALLSSAEGYIREVATGTAAELGRARGEIIDNGTTTAVVVRLP